MSELVQQKRVIDDFKKAFPNAFAFKMSHRFLSGLPDLLLKAEGHDVLMVEMKVAKYRKAGYVTIETTLLQRQTMMAMEKSGLRCEVWVVVTDATGTYMLRCPPEATRVECTLESLTRKERGRPWPMADFLNNPVRR